MFDDLRPRGSAFDDDEEPQEREPEISAAPAPAKAPRRRRSTASNENRILGMTAAQRLVIAIMLFLNVSVLGGFLLIATGAVYLPF